MTLPIMGTRYYTANCPSTGSGFSEIPGSNPSSFTYYTCFGGQVTQHLSYLTYNLGVLIMQTDCGGRKKGHEVIQVEPRMIHLF